MVLWYLYQLALHHRDVVLVLGRVHSAAKGVTGFPEDAVDIVLKDVFLQDFVLGDGGG